MLCYYLNIFLMYKKIKFFNYIKSNSLLKAHQRPQFYFLYFQLMRLQFQKPMIFHENRFSNHEYFFLYLSYEHRLNNMVYKPKKRSKSEKLTFSYHYYHYIFYVCNNIKYGTLTKLASEYVSKIPRKYFIVGQFFDEINSGCNPNAKGSVILSLHVLSS